MEYLLKILDRFDGNKTALAKRLKEIVPDSKITPTHIINWIHRDGKVPESWVLPLSEAAEWRYTPHQINSQLYPHPDDGLPQSLRCGCKGVA